MRRSWHSTGLTQRPASGLFRSKASIFAGLMLATNLYASALPVYAESAIEFNRRLGTGINLGNALDAPKEGDWGVVLQPEYFRLIKEAGFKHIRLPVRWSTHTGPAPNYAIDPAFFARIDWAIEQARANNLAVVINMHHFEELETDVEKESARFLAMWQQIAEHLRKQPNTVAFEIYNEPAKSMSADKWNSLFTQALQIVRRTNPKRCIVVGPANWNSIDKLSTLELPEDQNLLVTVHYYQPFHFTHQGAEWVGSESAKWLGTKWTGSEKEISDLTKDFDTAAEWGRKHSRPIYLGEFGAYSKADMDSRALWTTAVRTEAVKHEMAPAYWEFCSGFGAYDPEHKEWRLPLLKALTSPIP